MLKIELSDMNYASNAVICLNADSRYFVGKQ